MAHIAMTSEHLFPARCCPVEVPIGLVLSTLDARGKKQYTVKKREYAVPPAQRLYCPSEDCGRWIPPKYVRERDKPLKCPTCKTKICTTCGKTSHEVGKNCADDPNYIALLHLARARKWQQCPRCQNMIESLDGCLEVRCRCNMVLWFVSSLLLDCRLTTRSYKCGNPWKSRDCQCLSLKEKEMTIPRLSNFDEDAGFSSVISAIRETGREQNALSFYPTNGEKVTWRDEEERRLLIDERVALLTTFLAELNKRQQIKLINRQNEAGAQFLSKQKEEVEQFHHQRHELMGKQQRNLNTRVQRVKDEQTLEIDHTSAAHAEEENDLNARLPRLLKDEGYTEEKHMGVLCKLRSLHEAEKDRLVKEHEDALRQVEERGSVERAGLEAAFNGQWETEQQAAKTEMRELVQGFVYDRYWFDKVVSKRGDMLGRYRLDLVDSEKEFEGLVFTEVDGAVGGQRNGAVS